VRVYRQVISYRCIAGEHLIWIRVVEWDLIYASMYMYIYIYIYIYIYMHELHACMCVGNIKMDYSEMSLYIHRGT
jgi:hypothetical protein